MSKSNVICKKNCKSNCNGLCVILNDTSKYREEWQHCPFKKDRKEKK